VDVTAGLPFEAVFESGLIGLVPGIEIAIIDNVGNVVVAASGTGITEQVVDGNPDTGIYACIRTAPADEGQYTLVWSTDGSFDVFTVTVEDLVVRELGTVLPPIGVPASGVSLGPCSMWADINAIAGCCDITTEGIDPFVLIANLTSAMTATSEVLYLASGKQFAGACQRTVRPCDPLDPCSFGLQVLSRGHLVGWDGMWWGGFDCGCRPVSEVKLAGSVRSITEVMIDGVVIDPATYFVRNQKWLIRKNGARWPFCQTQDVDDDAPGAFAVTYVYGKTPPELGQRAAISLACEIYKSCTGAECSLPTGVTRVTRQGVTIERAFFQRDAQGVWRTGIAAVDLFLNTVNPRGLQRAATFWSPHRRSRYAPSAPS
jgi:hypothetical protein